MILYFLTSILSFFVAGVGPVAMSSASAELLADRAIYPQLFTGYPLVALLALNLARRRLPVSQPAASRLSQDGG
jgi:hypothetical protein